MITTFKTKQPVLVDPRKKITAEVFVDILDVIFYGHIYEGRANYYYKNGDVRIPMEETTATFYRNEADQLAAMGPLSGTFSDQFLSLIIRATMYQFSSAGYFGLTSADWEVYIEPEKINEEIIQE